MIYLAGYLLLLTTIVLFNYSAHKVSYSAADDAAEADQQFNELS